MRVCNRTRRNLLVVARWVGRPLGPQPKRKAVEDLGENAHTKRSRQHTGNFTEDEREVEWVKTANKKILLLVILPWRKYVKGRLTKG